MHNYRIRTNDIVHTVCMSNHFTASVKTLVLILPMTLIILKCFCITGLCHLVPGVGHPARALPRPPLRPWHPSRRPGTPLGSPLCVAVLKPDWETSRRWTIGRLRCDHDHDEHTRLGSLRVRDSESESPGNRRACVSKVATRCRHDCHRNQGAGRRPQLTRAAGGARRRSPAGGPGHLQPTQPGSGTARPQFTGLWKSVKENDMGDWRVTRIVGAESLSKAGGFAVGPALNLRLWRGIGKYLNTMALP
jgi:hypothetical protein